MGGSSFGEFFRGMRIRRRVTLREFCQTHGFDPGNISKLERGRMSPPRSRKKLEQYARALGIEEGSEEWYDFFDLAAACRGEVPAELLADEQVLGTLPVLFRTLRGQKVPDHQLDELIEIIRKA